MMPMRTFTVTRDIESWQYKKIPTDGARI